MKSTAFALALVVVAFTSIAAAREPGASMLVTPSWLAQHLDDPDLVLLHVGDRKEYDSAHIPGAQFISLDQISSRGGGGGLMLELLPAETLAERFAAFGISDASRIVVYFGSDWITPATRVYFTLDYLGLGDRASLLDGGMPAWQAAGQRVTTDLRTLARGRITPHPRPDLVARLDWMKEHLRDPSTAIVDARLRRFYEGRDPGSMLRPGRLPGARSVPFTSLTDGKGALKSIDELRRLLADAGIQPGRPVVSYCHIGQQATLVYFVAKYLGHPARLYDGSFEEWSRETSLPVETLPVSQMPESRITLVTPAWIAEHGRDPGVRVLDVRPNAYDYFVAHAPGAIHLPEGIVRGPLAGLPVQYHPVWLLAQLLTRAGVGSGQRIVVYSDGMDVLGATMIAYLLERLGQRDIALVDGGWSAVPAATGTQEYPSYEPGAMEVTDKRSATSVTIDELKALAGKPGVAIVDARPAAHYRGESRVWIRNGHIPGAVNLEWRTLADASNPHALKPLAELRAIVDARGLKPSDDVIVYCGTGREASLEYVVLKHLLGFPRVRLYDGSWGEYAARREMPVATGPEPGR